jgi:DNA phosphorothioation system restriction enzyme
MTGSTGAPSLRSLDLADRYRSDHEDVVAGFYVPALSVSVSYSRAVGYFTSTSLALFARGIREFADGGGTMRLVASPHLNEDDIIDIERGYEVRKVIERATLRELAAENRDAILDGLGLIGRLIAEQRLDIKLAFVVRQGRIGIYHEKLGIFRDSAGDLVAFTGSANETLGGLLANFESVQVYRGWLPVDGPRALRLEHDFEDLWHNRTASLRVEPFPDVARERLIEIATSRPAADLPARDDALEPPAVAAERPARLEIPSDIVVRDYQRKAVEAWLGQRGRGILKMATGTGKTKTAMFAACQLGQVLGRREQPLIVLIIVPLQHLVDQWIPEVESFGVRPVAVYESSQRWLPIVEDQLAEAHLGQRPVVALVATNASFAGDRFQSVLSRITQPLLVIADEAHNLGSSRYRSALPQNATYRLALSATPERWFDDAGTDALTGYFGPVVFELGLGQAIEMGALCRYRYLPRLVELSDDENELYVSLTTQIAQRLASGESLDDDEASPMGFLLRRRAAVLGHAEGKLPQLYSDMSARRDAWYQLVYCAEGNKPAGNGEPPGPSQISQVIDLIGNDLHLAVHSYVAETSRAERQVLLRRFGAGDDLRVLVAMRCLDEGVDIPDARVAYLLASSSNPRQFIQRRGRILRPAPGKDRADIIDYLAIPQAGTPLNFDVERNLLTRELERANEFGKLAENYEATLALLRPLKEKYQLMHL